MPAATPTPLESIRLKLALPVGENAAFDGWNGKAIDTAAEQIGVDLAQARLAFPGRPADMVDAYIQGVDAAMEAHFTPKRIAEMRIRDRIRALVWYRLEVMAPAREAVRTGLSLLAMPQNVPLALKIGWRSADLMWRIAGDTATDYNHYSKRLILSGVYASTLLNWLDDQSEGWMDTGAFLDRRLAGVMRFERWKADWRGSDLYRPSLTRFLGRLRYPAK